MARTETPITFLRSDYKSPAYTIRSVQLDIALNPLKTLVVNHMKIERMPGHENQPLVLQGEGQELISVRIDGKIIQEYETTAETLTLKDLPEK
jgi:aminopeptidase N